MRETGAGNTQLKVHRLLVKLVYNFAVCHLGEDLVDLVIAVIIVVDVVGVIVFLCYPNFAFYSHRQRKPLPRLLSFLAFLVAYRSVAPL